MCQYFFFVLFFVHWLIDKKYAALSVIRLPSDLMFEWKVIITNIQHNFQISVLNINHDS